MNDKFRVECITEYDDVIWHTTAFEDAGKVVLL